MVVADGVIVGAIGAVWIGAGIIGKAYVANSKATTEASIKNQAKITESFTAHVSAQTAALQGITDQLKTLCDSQPDRDVLSKCMMDQTEEVKKAIQNQVTATRSEHTKITTVLEAICKQLKPVDMRKQVWKLVHEILTQGEEDMHAGEVTAKRIQAEEVMATHVKAEKVKCKELLREEGGA